MATYLLTEFSPYIDAYRFNNNQWDIGPDEASAIYGAFTKLTATALAVRLPFVDVLFDAVTLGLGPLLGIPHVASEVEKVMTSFIEGISALDTAGPAFCCGMCYCALDSYSARAPNVRGTIAAPKHSGSADDAKLRAYTLARHIDAWTSGGAIAATLEWKLIQKTQDPDVLRRRSATKLGAILASLRNNEPVPLLVHQLDDDSPFSSHCVVAYGAKIEGNIVELLIYDPNHPVDRDEGEAADTDVSRLVIELEGTVEAPTSVKSLALPQSSWTVFAFDVIRYAPKAPALVSLAQAAATVTRTPPTQTVALQIANRGTGAIGPFTVEPRASYVTSTPSNRDWITRIGSRRFVTVRDASAVPSETATNAAPPPVARVVTLKDQSPNAAITLQAGAQSRQELTFMAAQAMLVTPVAHFSWRSAFHDEITAQTGVEPTYVRRIANAGVMVGASVPAPSPSTAAPGRGVARPREM